MIVDFVKYPTSVPYRSIRGSLIAVAYYKRDANLFGLRCPFLPFATPNGANSLQPWNLFR
jgi:hypothetical protein